MTDVTKVTKLIQEANDIRIRINELAAKETKLIKEARDTCGQKGHPAIITDHIPREDEYGKQLKSDVKHTCAVCGFSWTA